MPIKTSDILLSRIFVVLIINYLYEALIAIPGGIVYFTQVPFDLLKLLFFLNPVTICGIQICDCSSPSTATV